MKQNADDPIRPHVFDGIQEYDKRLPNWWLATLWGSVVFSVIYWAWCHTLALSPDPGHALQEQMDKADLAAAQNAGVLTDETLWKLSKEAKVIEAGRSTFLATCAVCHRPDMLGQIGPNLVDQQWVSGGKPTDVSKTITEGVLAKGMPPWGPVLGRQKITEVSAFIMSHHKEGEPVEIRPWVPITAPPPPAQ